MLGSAARIEIGNDRKQSIECRNTQPPVREVPRAAKSFHAAVADDSAYFVHEICQPLNAMMLNAETALRFLMQDPPRLQEAQKAIERIVGNGQRAGSMVHTARNLARPSNARNAEIDLHALIHHITDLMKADLTRHNVVVDIELADSSTAVNANSAQLQQVVSNLMTNAIEAMSVVSGRSRTLRISTRLDERDFVRVSIEDSGVGLDTATIDDIFDPFFTTKGDGMGLGLSICSSIVEEHGGRLWAIPRQPHGSTFCFTVPAR